MATSSLRAGDWVEVRGREEILATLDATPARDGATDFDAARALIEARLPAI